MCVCVCVQRVSNSLYPMDYIVQGIFQARILEWAAFPFSRGPSQPRDQTQVSRIAGRFFTTEPQGKLTQLKNRKILYLRCTCVCVRVCICKALSIYCKLQSWTKPDFETMSKENYFYLITFHLGDSPI